MNMTFSISNGVDVSKLDKQIRIWLNDNQNRNPIICMKRETAYAIIDAGNLFFECNNHNGRTSITYKGYKLSFDEQKHFGEIELS